MTLAEVPVTLIRTVGLEMKILTRKRAVSHICESH